MDLISTACNHELPLAGISIASAGESPNAIAINLGKAAADHLTHTITKPEHVWLEQTSGGANAALEIESENETKTLLRFRGFAAGDGRWRCSRLIFIGHILNVD
jgi:hypothetical protein